MPVLQSGPKSGDDEWKVYEKLDVTPEYERIQGLRGQCRINQELTVGQFCKCMVDEEDETCKTYPPGRVREINATCEGGTLQLFKKGLNVQGLACVPNTTPGNPLDNFSSA